MLWLNFSFDIFNLCTGTYSFWIFFRTLNWKTMIDFILFWFSFTDRFFHAHPKLERETAHEQQRKVDILKMALSINEESTIQIVVSHHKYPTLWFSSIYLPMPKTEQKKTSTKYYTQPYTLKKKGILRNHKRIFPWAHGKILLWFCEKKVSYETDRELLQIKVSYEKSFVN